MNETKYKENYQVKDQVNAYSLIWMDCPPIWFNPNDDGEIFLLDQPKMFAP